MRDSDGDQSLRLRTAIIVGHSIDVAEEIVRRLTPDTGLSILVALPGVSQVAERLSRTSAIPVISVVETLELDHDRIYVLPDDRDLAVNRAAIVVEPRSGKGTTLDRLLRSLGESFGRESVGVVIAGHDGDGALGIKRIKEAGGLTICQRLEEGPESALPRAAIETGVIDLVLPLDDIASRIVALAHINDAPLSDALARTDDTLRDILTMIRIRTGHDFNWYKRATLYRRLARRMQVCQTETLAEYHRLLREHPSELGNLLRDFLISVTNFFRDPEAFESLAEHVIPRLFRGKESSDQVRVWVAGCATGEEAYSFAILLCEYAGRLPDPPQLQIFATDIDEQALHEARAGVYPEQIVTDVSPRRLERFFVRENGGYRVSKELREIVLFSPHNVLRDPPFSRLDLVSCRNLLIYLNRDAQDRVLGTFHFALKPDGILFLGSSESAENTQQFSTLDAKNRIFERRIASTSVTTDALVATTRWLPSHGQFPQPTAGPRAINTFGELHHRAVELYASPSVLVNDELDVVHFSERAGKYFELAGGEPTRQVLRLINPALRFELRGALYAARQPDRRSDTRVVRFDDNGKTRAVELRVRAVDLPEAGRGTLLVMFDELDTYPEPQPEPAKPSGHMEPVVREMEDELHRTRDQLRTTIEQYETSLEELKASNEELHAINEELRSATEKLETSKEELQSVNEELTTLNHELKVKIDEVSRANSDLQNLMTSTEIGVLFLDRNLHIKRFTPRLQDVFNIIPSDIGRPFAHLTHRLDASDLPRSAATVLQDLHTSQREVRSLDGRQYLVRMLPYRSIEDRIDGVVLTFVDVTEMKTIEEAHRKSTAALRSAEARLTLALKMAPIAIISHDKNLETIWSFIHGKQQGATPQTAAGIFANDSPAKYSDLVRDVFRSGVPRRAELEVLNDGHLRTFDFRVEPTYEDGAVVGVTSVGFDITPSKTAESSLRESDRRKDEFLALLSHELRNPLTPLRVAFDIARMPNVNAEQLAYALTSMDSQINILVRLVDDLLDVSRIAQGKIQLVTAPVDAARVVESALEAVRPLIEEAGHTIHVELPSPAATIVGDFTRLTQILTNLLTNATKYTPHGGKLELLVARDSANKSLLFSVRDNGIGMSADFLPRVFDMFVQASSDPMKNGGGLGVGLNLVRRLVELHGGSVRAASDGVNKGSTFVLELPLANGG